MANDPEALAQIARLLRDERLRDASPDEAQRRIEQDLERLADGLVLEATASDDVTDQPSAIVFITHDFDEAIRLADRIAIMKDGEIIQIGAPEELVLNPATDYVAEFTRDVNRAKVMSAQSLMTRGKAGARPVVPGALLTPAAGLDIVSVGWLADVSNET